MIWNNSSKTFSYYIDKVLYGIYKRVTSFNGNFYQQILIHWMSNSNIINTDFYLFSTYLDLHNNTNKWQYCNYDDATVGIFRDCGKSNLVGGNWLGNGSTYTLGLVPFGRSASVYLK